MNALELADKLKSSLTMEYECDKYMEQAATMLRQQQAEIEAVKAEKLSWMMQLDIEKLVIRDLEMDLLRSELEALKECIRQYELTFNLRKAQEK